MDERKEKRYVQQIDTVQHTEKNTKHATANIVKQLEAEGPVVLIGGPVSGGMRLRRKVKVPIFLDRTPPHIRRAAERKAVIHEMNKRFQKQLTSKLASERALLLYDKMYRQESIDIDKAISGLSQLIGEKNHCK